MTIRLNFNSGTVDVDIQQLMDKIKKATLEELDESADMMVDYAQMFCRRDTGALAESIRKENFPERVCVVAGGSVTNPKTGRLVDYAAIREALDRFMEAAWRITANDIEDRIKQRAELKVRE